MIQKYTFCGSGTLEFDDSKSVKELIEYAFDTFEYYEPMGMDIVTLFQAHHPNTTTGWFTTDVTLRCADEIKDRDWLCFAYHMPNVFYFAEGGWGHHMPRLGNRPSIDDEVTLKILFDDFDNSVVVNGKYTFCDIIDLLKRTEYISDDCRGIEVIPVGCSMSFAISFEDPIMKVCLPKFKEMIKKRIHFRDGDYLYHIEFRIF